MNKYRYENVRGPNISFLGTLKYTRIRKGPKIGRNDPCPCGSGKKYQRCCLDKDEIAEMKGATNQKRA